MSSVRCQTCSTLRPANATYCPKCGSPFQAGVGRAPDPMIDLPPPDFVPDQMTVDLSVLAGLKFGVGFAIGASLVGLVLFVVGLVLLSTAVAGMFR